MAADKQNIFESSDSDEDVPLAKKFKDDILENIPLSKFKEHSYDSLTTPSKPNNLNDENLCQPGTSGLQQTFLTKTFSSDEEEYDSDKDPEYFQKCEVKSCNNEGLDLCNRCDILLCAEHLIEVTKNCKNHGKNVKKTFELKTFGKINNSKLTNNEKIRKPNLIDYLDETGKLPEFAVEGNEKEVERPKVKRKNMQKEVKFKKTHGYEYRSIYSKKIIPAKVIGPECNVDNCKKNGRDCYKISEHRESIFKAYYELDNIDRQREFILRHVEISETKQKTSKNKEHSRRQNTIKYFMTAQGNKYLVCKTCFLNTLSITDRVTRTAISKLTNEGSVEKDKRGGRQSKVIIDRDKKIRQMIDNHIAKFPRVESHYCRADTTKEYLHPSLNLPKLYNMFVSELKESDEKPSYSTYVRVFKTKNLAFHHPKKDQCSLCISYRQGNDEMKLTLKEKYDKHILQKDTVRSIKEKCKKLAENDNTHLAAVFDLQQVIYLPISNENALFYKNRLSNYNLTIYNLGNKDCFCYMWHEAASKRGSSEISTAVYHALQHYDEKGIKTVTLFSDGTWGQNKNTIVASMLLYAVNRAKNIHDISLRYFEVNHGQSEGDSCHSTISGALERAGDVMVPAQLYTICKLARLKQPYLVFPLQYSDFLDFKKLSKEMRIVTQNNEAKRKKLQKTVDSGESVEKINEEKNKETEAVNWTQVMEFKVTKSSPNSIFYKTDHQEKTFKEFALKRMNSKIEDLLLTPLNDAEIKLPKKKYSDLVDLCTGDLAVIRQEEYKKFYFSLPHEDL
jgi:hypothetical protein